MGCITSVFPECIDIKYHLTIINNNWKSIVKTDKIILFYDIVYAFLFEKNIVLKRHLSNIKIKAQIFSEILKTILDCEYGFSEFIKNNNTFDKTILNSYCQSIIKALYYIKIINMVDIESWKIVINCKLNYYNLLSNYSEIWG